MLNEDIAIVNWSLPERESTRDAQSDVDRSTPAFPVEDCIVPSLTEVLVTATLSVDTFQKLEGVPEMSELFTLGLLEANVLVCVASQGKVPIRVATLSLRTLQLRKNKIVADFVAAPPRETAEEDGSTLYCNIKMAENPDDGMEHHF